MSTRDAAELETSSVDRRIVSVLFADVVGFTPLSERLDPEDVATIQDAYFSATRETIERHGGVVEKFIGDAVMAVFGAPLARDDDAERAVHAGLALLSAIERIGARLGLEPGTLQLRVGVNTGEVVHATTGPDAGRVTGDTVNTAARLQTAARPGSVFIGELTAMSVAESIETIDQGPTELKGKREPIPVWEATGVRAQPSREEALGALHAPMLGRDDELAELIRGIGVVSQMRSARLMVIVAPPGVGKSRLLAEFAAAADATVFRARVRPQGTATYEPVAQLLAAAGSDLARSLAAAGVVSARAAVIQDEVDGLLGPGMAVAGSGDLAAERTARFDAWVTALDAAAEGPSVWLMEDVHWAGGDLLAFLTFAAAAPTRHGRLVVTTARPSLLDSAPEWCEAGGRLDLAPLPAADAASLVQALVGDALPDELVRAVVARSDGTPLFIEELLRTWAGVGTLVHHPDGWTLAMQPDAVPLPPTVQAIYGAQLDDLPADARLVARRGAVAGRRLPVAALAALDLGDHRAGLGALARRAFLAGPTDDPITGESYAYRHALLRDAGYASLARAERARLHVAMAAWLTGTAGDRAEIVAETIAEHHASALDSLPTLAPADLPDRASLAAQAASWYDRAADAALGLSAMEAAIRLLRRSIELSAQEPPLAIARRRLRLGEVLASSAELDLGINEIEAARDALAAEADSTFEYERAAYALGLAYMQQIRFPEATSVTADGIAHLGAGPANAMTARLLALHAWSLAANGEGEGMAAEADAALAAARDGGDPERELNVLEHWCATRDELGLATERDWGLLGERATALGRWRQVVVAGRVRAMLRAFKDPRGAIPLFDAVIETATAHGLTEQAGWCEYGRCETLWVLGEDDAALDSGLRVLELAERNAYHRLAFRTFMILLPIAASRGDAGLAARWDRWWAGAERHFPPNPSPYGRMLRGAYLVWLAQATGGPVPAPPDDLLDAAVLMSNPHFLAAIETVVRAWLDADRGDLAAAMAERIAARLAAEKESTDLMRASAALLEAWVTGSHGSAARSAQLAASLPAPWWEARARAAGG